MNTELVKKMEPLDRFLYWMRERHQIHLRRRAGKPKPWTDDSVLQTSFFTNPYRENDKVTQWFKRHIREPLRDDSRVLFATVCFRWFNFPRTASILMDGLEPKYHPWDDPENLITNWNPDKVLERLGLARERGEQIFTGAYMVNSPPGEKKLEAIVRRVDNVWKARESLLERFHDAKAHENDDLTMEKVHRELTQFDGMGGFGAYEVVCDLRWTYLLENAPDKLTWCNPGPGCVRGLYRIKGWDFPKGNNSSSPPAPKNFMDHMRELLSLASARLRNMPALEMREIEHSLCEFDKYERVLWGDGKAKRSYKGV